MRAAYGGYEDYRNAEVACFVRDKVSADEFSTLYEQNRRIFRTQLRAAPDAEIDALARSAVHTEIKNSGRVAFLSLEEFSRSHQSAIHEPA